MGQDTTNVVSDSIPTDSTEVYFLTGLNVAYDYGKLALSFSDFESKQEVTAHIEVIKFQGINNWTSIMLSGEYGFATINPRNAYQNANYQVEGSYFRFGADLMRSIDAKNNIGIGVRYASAAYEDQGTVQIESESPLFGTYNREFARTGMSANWWELVITSEGKLFRIYNPEVDGIIVKFLNNFYWGAHIRFRTYFSYDAIDPDIDPLDTYTVPGYGRTFSRSVPAINLIIKYKLNFKQD